MRFLFFFVFATGLAVGHAHAFDAAPFVDCSQPDTAWSDTRPPVNLTHIFCGEINRRGKAVGFHVRPLGQDPVTARLVALRDGPDGRGVYTAMVEILDPGTGESAGRKFSSMFPDDMAGLDILNAILDAHLDSGARTGKFRGSSGHGFAVEGWINRIGGRLVINTAYPIYRGP